MQPFNPWEFRWDRWDGDIWIWHVSDINAHDEEIWNGRPLIWRPE